MKKNSFSKIIVLLLLAAFSAHHSHSQSLQTYSKFDFIPGETVIFFDDFSDTPVGDFPAAWNTNHGGEVVSTNLFEGKWFKLPAGGDNIFAELADVFPTHMTIEFDLIPIPVEEAAWGELVMTYYSEPDGFDLNAAGVPGTAGVEVTLGVDGHRYANYEDYSYLMDSETEKAPLGTGKIRHVSIWVQKTRFRVYVDEQKIFDLPKALPAGHTYNRFRFNTINADFDALIGNFRIAAGATDSRSKLLNEGILVSRGILFDSGSDRIRPESYGAMKEIALVLQDNPAVQVMIVGHTDSDGSESMNLELSRERAVAVRIALNSEFGIDMNRMQTDGKGESEPVDSNETPAGKANNRRVVFIKL